MDIDAMIAVMQAYKEGKEIELRRLGSNNWELVFNPSWDWYRGEYRIKPEPKRVWVVEFKNDIACTVQRFFCDKKEAEDFANTTSAITTIKSYIEEES